MSSNLVIITGDDLDLIRKKTSETVKKAAGESADEFSLDILRESDDSTPIELISDLIKSIQTPSFFGQKTVCLQNCSFLDREGSKTDKSPLAKVFHELAALIAEGIPQDIFLIVSGNGLDSRKSIMKAAAKSNAEIHNFKKLQLSGKWQEQVQMLLRSACQAKQLNLTGRALEYLCEVIGTETGRIETELEKIFCACPGKESIDYLDIVDICTGNASTAVWAFSNALGDRKLQNAYKAIDNIIHQSKDQESVVMSLLYQTATHFRTLLKLKILMQQASLRGPDAVYGFLKNLTPANKEQFKNNDLIKMHPYRAKILAQSASLYSGQELIQIINNITKANRKLVTSAIPRRMLLEQLALMIIKGNRTTIQG
ncbi:MAG: DNA polymerase III subunit delta [Lentisphaeraceae bacterium]|nr:DNA polymerase III subunit delta [Lentisphaeraceae bacterium]